MASLTSYEKEISPGGRVFIPEIGRLDALCEVVAKEPLKHGELEACGGRVLIKIVTGNTCKVGQQWQGLRYKGQVIILNQTFCQSRFYNYLPGCGKEDIVCLPASVIIQKMYGLFLL